MGKSHQSAYNLLFLMRLVSFKKIEIFYPRTLITDEIKDIAYEIRMNPRTLSGFFNQEKGREGSIKTFKKLCLYLNPEWDWERLIERLPTSSISVIQELKNLPPGNNKRKSLEDLITAILQDYDTVEDFLNCKKKIEINQFDTTSTSKDFQEKVEEAKNKYFKYLEIECGNVLFDGLPTEVNSNLRKVKLENIFIPLYLNEIERNSATLKISEKQEQERKEIGEVLQKEAHVAILARPGCGKSTLINSLVIAYAFPDRRKRINETLPNRTWFPIFIRCRNLGEEVTSSITGIINNIPKRAELHSYSEQFEFLVTDSLQNGNALLLIDGLDEIMEDGNRILFIKQLQIFLTANPNICVVVTSRITGFRIVAGACANYFTQYSISSLDDKDIETFITKWHKVVVADSENIGNEVKELTKTICSYWNIKALGKNPLLLTALLFVNRLTGSLPSKVHVLYQEMIDLLLVTWNIDGHGHEKLEKDEAVAQIAYVAYWMAKNNQLTINEEDLKKCLLDSRKQMPEILRFANISVNEFIRRIEQRSSLLLKSGHANLESGIITPVYEFLHLSFHDYLTSIAIINNFLPKEDSNKTPLEILTSNITNDYWREIQIYTVRLLKNDSKELIEYLISESKKITKEERIIFRYLASVRDKEDMKSRWEIEMKKFFIRETGKEVTEEQFSNVLKKFLSVELLGQYIANEIPMSLELLNNASEWFAKNYISEIKDMDRHLLGAILTSNNRDLFIKRVRYCFFNQFEDEFAQSLVIILTQIETHYYTSHGCQTRIESLDTFFASINNDILNGDMETKCLGLLQLPVPYLWLFPEFSRLRKMRKPIPLPGMLKKFDALHDRISKDVNKIFASLIKTALLDNPHFYYSVAWSLAFCDYVSKEIINDYTGVFINNWLKFPANNLTLTSSQFLIRRLNPDFNFDISTDISNIKYIICKIFKQPRNELDRLVAIYLGIIIGLEWNIEEVKTVFKYANNDYPLSLFAKKIGLNIDTIKSE